MSCVDHQRKWVSVGEFTYHVWSTKENVLKLQSLYIMCGSPKKMFKVVECIYHVWITSENVLKLQSLYIMCGSPKKMF